jgi:hypothetical protein
VAGVETADSSASLRNDNAKKNGAGNSNAEIAGAVDRKMAEVELLGEVLEFLVEVGAEVAVFYEHAEDVFEGEVGLLDVHRDFGGDDDVVVAEVGHFASAVAGKADGGDVHLFGLMKGIEDVGGVAGGGDAEEDVAGLAEGFDLAREDVVEAEVVAGGGKDGGVGGEGDGAKGGAVGGEADDELGYEVLGVGGRASIAGDEELAAVLHGGGGEAGDGDDSGGDVFIGEYGLHGVDGLSELLVD